ncbi:unnamed protein product, partial [Meganyctiphanes norvegica]
ALGLPFFTGFGVFGFIIFSCLSFGFLLSSTSKNETSPPSKSSTGGISNTILSSSTSASNSLGLPFFTFFGIFGLLIFSVFSFGISFSSTSKNEISPPSKSSTIGMSMSILSSSNIYGSFLLFFDLTAFDFLVTSMNISSFFGVSV